MKKQYVLPVLALGAASLFLTGCASTSTADKFIHDHASLAPNSAVIMAVDANGRWAGGTAEGYDSEQKAIDEARAQCENTRMQYKVLNPCRLHAVNNRPVSEKDRPVSP